MLPGFYRLTDEYMMQRGETVFWVERCDVQEALSLEDESWRADRSPYESTWVNAHEIELYSACYNAYLFFGGEPQ